jgi:hypothetical protein
MRRAGNYLLRTAVGKARCIANGLITPGRRKRCGYGQRNLNDGLKDLSSMNRHLFWSFDTEPHLVTTNLYHNDGDVIVYDDALVFFSRKNKHFPELFVSTKCTNLPPLVNSSGPSFGTGGFVNGRGGL